MSVTSDSQPLNPPELIKTERLILRKAQMSDAAILYDAYMSDPDVAELTSWKPRTKLSQSELWIDHCIKQWDAGKSYAFVIEYEGKPMGMVGMHPTPDHVAFGYVIAKPYWGRGIMPEALNILIDWILAQDHINRVQIFCHIDNHRSQRVMEKCGLEYESTFIHQNNSGEPCDCKMYSKAR